MPVPVAIGVWVAVGAIASCVAAFTAQRGQHSVPKWQTATQVSATGVLFGLLTFRFGSSMDLLVPSAFTLGAVPLALEDARTSRLPNRLVTLLYGLAWGTILATWLAAPGSGSLGRAVAGMVVCLAFFGVLYFLVPGGLGGGDVKLAGALGATLGWMGWPVLLTGVLLGWLAAGVGHGLARLARHGRGGLPLGPFLLAAAIVVLLVPAW